MKKILVSVLAAIMLGSTLTACGKSNTEKPGASSGKEDTINISTKEIAEAINEKIQVRMPQPVDDNMAKDLFQLNLDDVEEYNIISTGISPGVDTIAIVKAKEGKVENVKTSFEKYLEIKKQPPVYPVDLETLESAKIEEKGNYIALLITMENEGVNVDTASKIFNEKLK
ncbi:DUF4358 domain-containing protein [Clostridium tarantellae]|uniref:DUF4358 domain-containing protein n=1 Tax=Clostridium tarantellae TaxID=39493 RepID=A0A6I1MY26_9CLOT|nr:DUF4358 domain-containing protein [Clostridium tarantellae]MPQ45039.1 DUF4358 domain-containing protein [Clostridium tarantellae]